MTSVKITGKDPVPFETCLPSIRAVSTHRDTGAVVENRVPVDLYRATVSRNGQTDDSEDVFQRELLLLENISFGIEEVQCSISLLVSGNSLAGRERSSVGRE